MNRDQLTSLRPNIPSIHQEGATSTVEIFQNKTIRPILKFQNDLLIDIFKNQIYVRKGIYHQLNENKKSIYIEEQIKKDQKFNNLLLGVIIGQFTSEEWNHYLFDEKEIKRRITNLIIKRLQDQINLFDH